MAFMLGCTLLPTPLSPEGEEAAYLFTNSPTEAEKTRGILAADLTA